ncbi:acyl-CoA dehydrogenase family protein [Thermodesulfobacteriota bacterium]
MTNKNSVPGGGMFLMERDIPFQGVFTPEDFSSEHKDIGAAVEDFIKGEITHRWEEIEELNIDLSKELMRKAGELGFLAIDIPERYDGMEMDKISSAITSEKFGYGAGSFTVTELNHTGIGTLPLALFGTDEQKKKYLPGLCSGELIGAFGLTEPEAGSDALNPRTTATLSDDGKHYILNGTKQFITNAGFADIIFTYAKVDEEHFTAFIVEQDWEGVSIDEEENKMGMHGTSTRPYIFDNVRIPLDNVLGEVGKGHLVALNALNMGRFKVGSYCIGSAKRAFFEALQYAKQRKQFGKAICEFGLIQEKLSEMAIRLFAAESMMYRTAGLIESMLKGVDMNSDDAGLMTARALEEYLIECSINKVFGSETEGYLVDEEVQIFGGYGYIKGDHPELAYRNARINRIWEGTNEINRLVIVNTLSRRAAKGVFDVKVEHRKGIKALAAAAPVLSDDPEALETQEQLLNLAKSVFAFVFGEAFKKHGKDLRHEQEVVGKLSNIIIEIWAMESALLRTLKLLQGKDSQKADIPMKMTKVLFHDGLQRIGFLATGIIEAIEDNALSLKYISLVRGVVASPPINTVTLRQDIARRMIEWGRYAV